MKAFVDTSAFRSVLSRTDENHQHASHPAYKSVTVNYLAALNEARLKTNCL